MQCLQELRTPGFARERVRKEGGHAAIALPPGPGLQTALTSQPTPPTVSTGHREHVEPKPPSAAPPPARPATPRRTQSRPPRADAHAHRGHAPAGSDGGGSCRRAAEGALSECFRGGWSPAVDTENLDECQGGGRVKAAPRGKAARETRLSWAAGWRGKGARGLLTAPFAGTRRSTKLSSVHWSRAFFLQSPFCGLLRS